MPIQNVDIKAGVSIRDLNLVAIPLSSLNDYVFDLYKICGDSKELVATYKKNNTGLLSITPDPSISNRGIIVINRSLTRTIKGKFYIEVFIQLTAGSEFIDMKQNMGANGVFMFDLETAANPNVLK